MFSSLFVCLSVSNFVQKNSERIRMKFTAKVGNGPLKKLVKFWWRSGSPSLYRDCFRDSSILGDTESGINRLRCSTLQCRACTSRRRHSNYDVVTSLRHRPTTDSGTDIATLLRRVLAEVCTAPMLLVFCLLCLLYCLVGLHKNCIPMRMTLERQSRTAFEFLTTSAFDIISSSDFSVQRYVSDDKRASCQN